MRESFRVNLVDQFCDAEVHGDDDDDYYHYWQQQYYYYCDVEVNGGDDDEEEDVAAARDDDGSFYDYQEMEEGRDDENHDTDVIVSINICQAWGGQCSIFMMKGGKVYICDDVCIRFIFEK